ncbi:FtsK/SpoIIIE domain-containing protein [Rossellomorea sp. BNER]|uniref:FtsK/SpoIIIE domain-containing protein n=1 Tax=Rossellomorea sp. BNER TaxID=2962031 RepID=UPI003AF218AC|nr:FtsK/SpoIIIE domain-containing protein [Rossellomorea sp. BNER]
MKDFIHKMSLKSRLKDCFRSAGLCFTSKMGDRIIYAYPKIHSINRITNENRTEIVFSLLNGLDPKEVHKKHFAFKQVFGQSIELKGDTKIYTLNIYHTPLTSNLNYSYKQISPYLDGMNLPIVTGQKKNGRYLVIDSMDVPHIIIQGVTGSGKSSAIRVILTTLIKYKRPEELDIYCIDGKKAEFGLFKKVEHVQAVVHSNAHARKILTHTCKMLASREDLLDTFDVPHINDLPIEHKPKMILVAIDEMIEYLDDKKIQESLIKISSKGRACGIILLASAQRFDADIIDTKARANFSIRMSFRCVDTTNARLLGTKGAENIKAEEKGRLILNFGEMVELQNPHLTYDKAKELLNPYCVNKSEIKPIFDDIEDLNTIPLAIEKQPNIERETHDNDDINLFL